MSTTRTRSDRSKSLRTAANVLRPSAQTTSERSIVSDRFCVEVTIYSLSGISLSTDNKNSSNSDTTDVHNPNRMTFTANLSSPSQFVRQPSSPSKNKKVRLSMIEKTQKLPLFSMPLRSNFKKKKKKNPNDRVAIWKEVEENESGPWDGNSRVLLLDKSLLNSKNFNKSSNGLSKFLPWKTNSANNITSQKPPAHSVCIKLSLMSSGDDEKSVGQHLGDAEVEFTNDVKYCKVNVPVRRPKSSSKHNPLVSLKKDAMLQVSIKVLSKEEIKAEKYKQKIWAKEYKKKKYGVQLVAASDDKALPLNKEDHERCKDDEELSLISPQGEVEIMTDGIATGIHALDLGNSKFQSVEYTTTDIEKDREYWTEMQPSHDSTEPTKSISFEEQFSPDKQTFVHTCAQNPTVSKLLNYCGVESKQVDQLSEYLAVATFSNSFDTHKKRGDEATISELIDADTDDEFDELEPINWHWRFKEKS